MKALFTLLFASCSLVASAQTAATGYAALPKDSASQKVVYSGVVPVAGASKGDLFNRAQEWGARSFADSKEASRITDKDAGSLLYKGSIKSKSSSIAAGDIYGFSLAIYVKDSRYKYVVDQLTDKPNIRGNDPVLPIEQLHTYGNERFVTKRVTELNAQIKALIASLTASMNGAVSKDF